MKKKELGNEALQISLNNSKIKLLKLKKILIKNEELGWKKTFENASLETLEKQVTHPPSTLLGESWEYSFVRVSKHVTYQ